MHGRETEGTIKKLSGLMIKWSYIFLGNPPPTSSAVTIDPIQRFSADLKVKYKCCPVASDKWPPTPSKKYVELAVVQGYSAGREEYIRHVSKGSIDEGHKTKYITEEQILDLCVELVGKGRVVVIEGAPGIGKSTLAWELCRKWEEYASMEAYSLVILLRLRDKRVQHLNDVSSLFYAYDRADRTSLVEEIKNNQGKGVLFVLDGFDELPKSLQYEGVLADLLRKSVLPQSTVLVTNRRSAMVSLLNICRPVIEKHIEILGFSPKSIEEYAASVFSGDDLEGFKSYISRFENPAISSLMYVPLYAVFVAMIYHDASKGALPCTLTQLYTKLCLTILNRNLETRTCYTSVRMFQKLPDTPYKQFLELSKLAYEGFEREEVIFYGDISEHFGFLDAVPDLYGGYNVSFNFLHLTLQEFFAAYHISQMSDSGVELFRYTGNDMRWNVVWRFVAGLTEFKFLDSSSVGISKHYNTLTVFFTQCLFEAQHMKIDFAYTFGCATMSHSAHDCTHFDYYALGYCIANCTTAGSSWKVDLGIASPDQVHAFTQGLMTNKSCTGVIELLQTTTNDVKCLHECILAAATSPLRSITDLRIYGATLTSNAERIHLFELISHMPRVQKLCIAYCDLRTASPHCGPMDNDGLLKLLLYLPHSNVTSLDLRETGLEHYLEQSPSAKDYCTAIQAMISPPSKLKKLRIRPHFTSCHEGNLAMMRLVSSPSTLRKLSVFVSFDCSLLKAFETDNHLTELKIRHVSGVFGENWPALVPDTVRIIQNSETLETLKLSGLDFRRDDILRDITAAVQRNNTLRHVRITVDVNQGDNTQLEKTLRDIDPRVTLTKP